MVQKLGLDVMPSYIVEVDHVGRGGVYSRGKPADTSGGVPGAMRA